MKMMKVDRLEDLMALNVKDMVFLDVTPCSFVDRYQRFLGTCSDQRLP
jgi:hypothetical protein